jgi:hypothetical protein
MNGLLDAEAEVYVLLIARVCVEVVRGATIELVALTEFTSDEEAESYCPEARGDPAYGFDEGRFLLAVRLLHLSRERKSVRDGAVLRRGVIVALCGAKPHAMDDSSRLIEIAETVVRFRCRFRVIGSFDVELVERLHLSVGC